MEETPEVMSHIIDQELAVVESKIEMPEIRQDGNDLIEVSEGCQQGADVGRVSKFVE